MHKSQNIKRGNKLTRIVQSVSQHWQWCVVGVIALVAAFVVGIYVNEFGELGLSDQVDHWGAFGDYVGGLLNPLVALAALILLAYSINIQRKELRESGLALTKQASHSRDLVHLVAMIATLEQHQRHLEKLERELGWFESELKKIPLADGVEETMELIFRRQALRNQIEKAASERQSLNDNIASLLGKLQSRSDAEVVANSALTEST